MKKIFLLSAVVCLFSSVTTSCIKMMQEANQAEKVHMITVSYKVNAVTGFVPYNGEAEPDPTFQTKGLEVNFINYQEGSSFKSIVGDNNIVSCSLPRGLCSKRIGKRYQSQRHIQAERLVTERSFHQGYYPSGCGFQPGIYHQYPSGQGGIGAVQRDLLLRGRSLLFP